jgi:hypothetical protein
MGTVSSADGEITLVAIDFDTMNGVIQQGP